MTTTVREKILAYLRDHGGPVTPAALGLEVEGSMAAIYEALRKMVACGELVRDGVGVYRAAPAGEAAAQAVTAPAPEPVQVPPPIVRPRVRFTPPPNAAEPQDTTDAPEPLQWALWHDGDLLLRRGEATLVLTAEERGRLLTWLGQREVA